MDKHNNQSSSAITRGILRVLSVLALIACVVLAIVAWRSGILSDEQILKDFVASTGHWGILVFIAIQIFQVIVPILPGGVSCLAGVVLFGPILGFIGNYVGICVGSILGFIIARVFGRKLLYHLFSPESIEKYDKWTQNKRAFPWLFGGAMMLPGLPDDLICYLAGTTTMTARRFVAILLPCKIFPVALYSLLPLLGL